MEVVRPRKIIQIISHNLDMFGLDDKGNTYKLVFENYVKDRESSLDSTHWALICKNNLE